MLWKVNLSVQNQKLIEFFRLLYKFKIQPGPVEHVCNLQKYRPVKIAILCVTKKK